MTYNSHFYALPVVKLCTSTVFYIAFVILSSAVLVQQGIYTYFFFASSNVNFQRSTQFWIATKRYNIIHLEFFDDNRRSVPTYGGQAKYVYLISIYSFSKSLKGHYFERISNRLDITLLMGFLVFTIIRIAAYLLLHFYTFFFLIVNRAVHSSPVLLRDSIYVLMVSTILAYVRLMHVFSFSPTLVIRI